MRPIRTVFFDLGDVVCRFLPQRRLDAFAAATGLPAEAIQRALWASGFSDDCDDGRYSGAEMEAQIGQRLNVSLAPRELRRLWATAFEPDAAVLAIAALVRQHCQTGLLTNNPPLLKTALSEWLPAIHQGFDPVVFSYEYRVRKPHAALFEAVRQRLGSAAHELLLIDDSLSNVRGAMGVGWQAIHFVTPDELEQALRDTGIIG